MESVPPVSDRLRTRRADVANKQVDLEVLVRRLRVAHDRERPRLIAQLTTQVARLRDEIAEGRRLLEELESGGDGDGDGASDTA